MIKKVKYSGLCETCEHDATCTLRRSSQLDIIQCEEFSIQPFLSKAPTISANAPSANATDSMEAVRMGLCVNCLHVLTCTFPNARRSVWQCEEYELDDDAVSAWIESKNAKSAA